MILDLSKKEHIPIINTYKKCKGISSVNKYFPNLSPINKMYVINDLEDWEKVESEFPAEMMTVRCDCKKGVNGKLPSGQTFNRDRVRGYIEKIKSAVPDAVIILEDLKEGSNERIHTQGGVNLDIKIGEYIYMDYVGPSFDCRELCTGKAAHESWNIPWDEVPFMNDSAIKKYKIYDISQEEYIETAKERMRFLIDAFPDRKDEIFETMPKKYEGINRQLFRDVREQIIFPIYLNHEMFSRDGLRSFGVEINVVEDGSLVPFEIEVPERFTNKIKDMQK